MGSPKTHKVLLTDGTEARAVRLSSRNFLSVLNHWVPKGSEGRSHIASKTGKETQKRIMLPVFNKKRLKAAYLDDWIVKSDVHGFFVVKFNDDFSSIFFVNPEWTKRQIQAKFGRWLKEISTEDTNA